MFKSGIKYFFIGGAGSGKTKIALNFSIVLAKKFNKVVKLVDLDIVNPYFRIREAKNYLNNLRVEVIAPPEPFFYSDLPNLPFQIESLFNSQDNVVND